MNELGIHKYAALNLNNIMCCIVMCSAIGTERGKKLSDRAS